MMVGTFLFICLFWVGGGWGAQVGSMFFGEMEMEIHLPGLVAMKCSHAKKKLRDIKFSYSYSHNHGSGKMYPSNNSYLSNSSPFSTSMIVRERVCTGNSNKNSRNAAIVPKRPRMPRIFRDTSFEQELCFSATCLHQGWPVGEGGVAKRIGPIKAGYCIPSLKLIASLPPKNRPKRPQKERIIWTNRWFSGVNSLLVSGRVIV